VSPLPLTALRPELRSLHALLLMLHSYPLAGRLKDILLAFTSASDLPLPANALGHGWKRARAESDDDVREARAPSDPFPHASALRQSFPASTARPCFPASAPRPFFPAPTLKEEGEEEISTFGPPLSPRSNGLFLFDQQCQRQVCAKADGSLGAAMFPPPRIDAAPQGIGQAEQAYAAGADAYPQSFHQLPTLEAYPAPPQVHPTPDARFAPQQPAVYSQGVFGLAPQMAPVGDTRLSTIPHDPAVVGDAAAVWSTMPVTFRCVSSPPGVRECVC
jgi:hypothetical protein